MEHSDFESKIIKYLKDSVKSGRIYFKSKYIAKEIGSTSKQVGTTLFRLSQYKKVRGIKVVSWSHSISTTWRVFEV